MSLFIKIAIISLTGALIDTHPVGRESLVDELERYVRDKYAEGNQALSIYDNQQIVQVLEPENVDEQSIKPEHDYLRQNSYYIDDGQKVQHYLRDEENKQNIEEPKQEPNESNNEATEHTPLENIAKDFTLLEHIKVDDPAHTNNFLVGREFVNELLGLQSPGDIPEVQHYNHNAVQSAENPLSNLAARYLIKSITDIGGVAMDEKLDFLRNIALPQNHEQHQTHTEVNVVKSHSFELHPNAGSYSYSNGPDFATKYFSETSPQANHFGF